MELTDELITRIAANARLKLSDAERRDILPQLSEVIRFFSKISEADVEDIKPSFHPLQINNALREDKIQSVLSQEEALANTHHKKEGYFKGPRAV